VPLRRTPSREEGTPAGRQIALWRPEGAGQDAAGREGGAREGPLQGRKDEKGVLDEGQEGSRNLTAMPASANLRDWIALLDHEASSCKSAPPTWVAPK
jgi:hypothetical protein